MNSKRLSELRYKGHITDSEYKELKLAIKTLEERPQGEWIRTINRYYECPFCHGYFRNYQKFCGDCGADMRIKDELNRVKDELIMN